MVKNHFQTFLTPVKININQNINKIAVKHQMLYHKEFRQAQHFIKSMPHYKIY